MQIDKTAAFALIEKYINAWKQNNIDDIVCCLSDNVIIIESHGPKYIGLSSIKKWFELWMKSNSKVIRWDIMSLHFCEIEQVAFCEWDFSCISSEKEYSLAGMSIIKFLDQKISFIHEYRMTRPSYTWDGLNLNSD